MWRKEVEGMKHKGYSKFDKLPDKRAEDVVVDGCLVLEGGAFRGVYAEGVLDVMMNLGLNFQTTIGVSAGAMNGLSYVAGQIGRAARFNLSHRHDREYVGLGCYPENKGIIGFEYAFHGVNDTFPLDEERLYDQRRKFIVTTTNCETGEQAYFDRDTCSDFLQAVKASASMPYVSDMVWIDGEPHLDGGCANKIPYQWALDQGFEKIVVVRTRHDNYRKHAVSAYMRWVNKVIYRKYPKFCECLDEMNDKYNRSCEELLRLRKEGRIFIVSPSKNWRISRIEWDVEKLGKLYWLGVRDMKQNKKALLSYLGR